MNTSPLGIETQRPRHGRCGVSVHEWRGWWLTVCHTCGATVSHTDPDTACRAVCHCRKDTRAKTITEDVA